MGLQDKSIEDLRACESKVSEELRIREDVKTLSEGGFRCSKCRRVFAKGRESATHKGMCWDDGYATLVKEVRSRYEALEKDHSKVEIFDLVFERTNRGIGVEDIEIEHLGGSDHAAVIGSLIIKIGDAYFEISPKTPDDLDEEGCKLTLEYHGMKPPTRRTDMFRWNWPKEEK